VHLRSAEFNAGEVSYEVVHDATLRFVFTYHVTDTKKIIIDTIIMKVQAYLAVLNNLGDSKSAKTV
jgi:hypothetical protein